MPTLANGASTTVNISAGGTMNISGSQFSVSVDGGAATTYRRTRTYGPHQLDHNYRITSLDGTTEYITSDANKTTTGTETWWDDRWSSSRSPGLLKTPIVPVNAYMGDSRTQWMNAKSGNITQNTAFGYGGWYRRRMRNRFRTDPSLNFGVASRGVNHVLNVQLPALLAANAVSKIHNVFLEIGTNNIGNIPPEDTVLLTTPQIVSTVASIIAQCNAAGIGVVFQSIVPQSAWLAGKRQQAAEVNRGYAQIARTAGANCRFIDANQVYSNFTTGNARSGYQYSDNVHDSPVGADAIAALYVTATDDMFPKAAELLPLDNTADYDATLAPYGNILTNGTFVQGTGGAFAATGTGYTPGGTAATDLAQNWVAQFATAASSTATFTVSKGTDATNNTIPTQIVTMGGTGDGNYFRLINATVNGTKGTTIPAGLVGQQVVFEGQVDWTGLQNIRAVTLRITLSDGTTTWQVEDGSEFVPPTTSSMPLPAAFSGLFRTPPITVPPGIVAVQAIEMQIVPIPGQALAGAVAFQRVTCHAI